MYFVHTYSEIHTYIGSTNKPNVCSRLYDRYERRSGGLRVVLRVVYVLSQLASASIATFLLLVQVGVSFGRTEHRDGVAFLSLIGIPCA